MSQCQECLRPLQVGTMVHTVYMQEHEDESCEWCDGITNDSPCDECGGTGKRGPGGTFYYLRCDDCEKFLQAVHDAEIAAGCPEGETQPPYEMMREYIHNGGMEEARKYWLTARIKFPELSTSGYLGWLWRKTFELVSSI